MDDEPLEDEPQSDPPKKARTFDFGSLNPYQPLVEDSPLGALEARSLNVRGFKELAKRDGERQFTPESFVPALVQQVVRPVDRDDGPLSDDEASSLMEVKDRFLPRLIEIVGFDREAVWETSTNEKGERVARRVGDKPILEREDGESDEEFLLRGWRDHAERTRQSFTDTFKGLSLNPLFAKSVASQLADNLSASQQLADRLADMRSPLDRLKKSSMADVLGIDREPARLVNPPIIQHPMKMTNDLLNDLGADIADMRELAVETAEMQRTLNDVARNILTEFTIGAADSRAAADKTLKVARYSLWIAGVSALFAAVAIVVTFLTSGPNTDELRTMGSVRDAVREQQQATEKEIQLLRDNQAAVRDLTARLPNAPPAPKPPKETKPAASR